MNIHILYIQITSLPYFVAITELCRTTETIIPLKYLIVKLKWRCAKKTLENENFSKLTRDNYRSNDISLHPTFKLLKYFWNWNWNFYLPFEKKKKITRGSYENSIVRYKVDTYYLLSGMLYIIFLLPYKYYIKLQSITESNLAHSLSRTHHMI